MMQKRKISSKWSKRGLLVVPAVLLLVQIVLMRRVAPEASSSSPSSPSDCALLLFGLPRAFDALALPSIRQNVLQYNPNCDIYVHFFLQQSEQAGRSGSGGTIHPLEIYHLRHEPTVSRIEFLAEEEDKFWTRYQPLLDKIHNTQDSQGKPLYFPWRARTYKKGTVDNIIKMWHSIESVWGLMEATNAEGKRYKTVAMLRADVMYVTPLRLDEYATDHTVVVPGFGRYPVSDRLVYGPYEAVRVWATERFARLEDHVQFIVRNDRGWGLHEERFLNYTIFPAIRAVLHHDDDDDDAIWEHPSLCFLRARADESVWISDCDGSESVALPSIRKGIVNVSQKVESILGRSCHGPPSRLSRTVLSLNCSREYALR